MFWWPPLWFWATRTVFSCACMYEFRMKFVFEAPGASILCGRYYSATMCRLIWGVLLLGRALLIGTLRYSLKFYNQSFYCHKKFQLPDLTVNSVWGVAVNSLWPSDIIWRHKSGSTLAQVMACCLMAPSHYLNQCWLIISKVQWDSSECNFTRDTSAVIHWN